MSDTNVQKDYTSISFDAANDIITEWNSTYKEFEGSRLRAMEDATFKVLEEEGISGGFPLRYDTAMEKIANGIAKEIEAAKAAIDSIYEADEELRKKMPPPPKRDDDNPPPGLQPDLQPEGIDNSEYQIEYYKNLSLDDLSSLIDFLNKASQEFNMPIDELLANEEQGSQLVKLMLESPNLSETYRVLLEEGKTEVSLVTLRNFVKGDYKEPIGFDNESTILTLKTYLTDITNNSSGEVSSIQPDAYTLSNYLLKGLQPISSTFKEVNKDNIQGIISSIYNGNYSDNDKITNMTRSIVGTNVNVLANVNNIEYDDVLQDEANREMLLESIKKLQRASVYSSLLSNCKDPTKVIESLLK